MTHLIILLILVASLPVLPFIYKKAGTGRRWTRFYLCMAMQEKKRKGFVLVMDALILSVNFLMFRISGPDLWLVPGFVVALLALKFKWTDAVLRWIHKDRKSSMHQLLPLLVMPVSAGGYHQQSTMLTASGRKSFMMSSGSCLTIIL